MSSIIDSVSVEFGACFKQDVELSFFVSRLNRVFDLLPWYEVRCLQKNFDDQIS